VTRPPNSEKIITVANVLSTSRLLLLGPIIYFLHQAEKSPGVASYNTYAVLIMVVAAATDFFDGFFARKFHQRSDLGRILDPLADKICIGTVGLVLVIYKGLPGWFLLVVVARDIAILALGLKVVRKRKFVPESTLIGKWTSGVLAALIVIYTLEIEVVATPLLVISLLMVLSSGWSYWRRYRAWSTRQVVARNEIEVQP